MPIMKSNYTISLDMLSDYGTHDKFYTITSRHFPQPPLLVNKHVLKQKKILNPDSCNHPLKAKLCESFPMPPPNLPF